MATKRNSSYKLFKEQDEVNVYTGDLDCFEHQMPKKYWNSELKNFFCEHDEGASNNCVHFKFILDKYAEDIKNLKRLSASKSPNVSEGLVSIFNITNTNFENIFELCKKFKDDLEIFGKSFLKSFYEVTNQDDEIFRLKDLIESIKFDNNGKADYVGIGANADREKNYLKLAKILISRNQNDINFNEKLDLTNKLIIFFDEYQKFLIKLHGQSQSIFSFLHQHLLKELFRMEGKNYLNGFSNIICPIVLREDIIKLTEGLNQQISINNNLTIEIQNLSNELKIKNQNILDIKSSYELNINNLTIKIQEFDKMRLKYEKEIQEQKVSIETYLSQIANFKNSNSSMIITIENNNKIINELKIHIEKLKDKEKSQLVSASSQADELSKIKLLYEKKMQELEQKNQSNLAIINNLNEEIKSFNLTIQNLNLKIQQYQKNEQAKDLSIASQAEELMKLKLSYESAIKEFENKILLLEKNLSEEKNHWQLLLNQKSESYELIIKKFEEERIFYEDQLNGGEDLKLQLQSQIKQNEILNTRIEELEKILNISNEKSEQVAGMLKKYNEYKAQIDELFMQKGQLEKQLLEKNNKVNQLNLQIESINLKNEGVNSEIVTLRELNKMNQSLQNTILVLTSQLEEANEMKTRYELENSEIKNTCMKLNVELSQANYKIQEFSAKIQKLQDELNQLRNYEKKIEILQNSKMEIDKLKNKLENNNYSYSLVKSSNGKMYNSLIVGASPMMQNNYNADMNMLESPERNTYKNVNNIQSQTDKVSEKLIKKLSFNNDSSNKNNTNNIINNNNSFSNFNVSGKNAYDFTNGVPDSIIANLSKTMLLTQKDWSLIKSWMAELNIGNGKKLNLNLLMKASRDGYSANIFKRKCHRKPSSLVVVLTSHDKLIGGFTPLSWSANDFVYSIDNSKKTFLFSLTNQKKYNIKNPNYAICHGNDIGPIFGGGSDLEIVSNCHKKLNNFSGIGHSFECDDSEEDFYGGQKYYVKDYEVYEVKY